MFDDNLAIGCGELENRTLSPLIREKDYNEIYRTDYKTPSPTSGKQAEIFDFVEFLAVRFGKAKGTSFAPDEWSEAEFSEFTI